MPPESVVVVTADGNYSAIKLADGESFILTLQLGQIERRIAEMLDKDDHRFIRIGKSLIVNRDYIAFINQSSTEVDTVGLPQFPLRSIGIERSIEGA